jgi:8-oxo-dGTP pyrophosphatase MutT (NUDIX family)
MADDVPIRPASTVLLLRDTTHGPEVFMLRRTTNAAFAGGMYVFPGGRVDESDGPGDRGYEIAAIRECFEEAGILLARTAVGVIVPGDHPVLAHRHDVHDGTHDLLDLCAAHGLIPATDELAWVSRWITPAGESTRRFDTRFFVAIAPPGQSSVHDDTETIASEWIRPAEALRRAAAGELTMMPPTLKNLEAVAHHASAAAALEWARTIDAPPAIMPRLKRNPAGKIVGVALPGEPDYDELED